MLERKNIKICEGVNVSCINDKKFTTSRISFSMFVPLKKNTVTPNALLMGILERGCRKYPDFQSFNEHLEQLYGANIYTTISKVGEVQVLTISATSINDSLTFNHENIVLNISNLLCDVIFNPCLDDGVFRNADIVQAKRQLRESIESEYNDKKLYSKLRCEELMCKNERYSISRLGKIEDIDKIKPEDIFETWKHLLQSARVEIIALGSPDFDTVRKVFSEAFAQIERKDIQDCKSDIIDKVDEIKEINESADVVQCKLVIGCRTPYSLFDDNIFAIRVMTALLGGTPNSKLFVHVREELSLCYYCAASFDKDKGIMLIESGVERSNIDRAKEEIFKCLEDIKKGNFTDDELDDTKKYLIQTFEKINDSLSGINGWYISQAIYPKQYTPEEYIKGVNNVSREEIMEAANNVKLDTIYILSGKEGNK